jgi:hypothetical protein
LFSFRSGRSAISKRRPGKAPSSRLPVMNAAAKMDNVRFMAQPCAKRVLSSTEIQISKMGEG